MSILERFKQKKAEFKEKYVSMQDKRHVERAQKLSELRKERIRLQGYEKIRTIEAKEKAEIKALKENTPFQRNLKKIGSKINANMKEQKNKRRVSMPKNIYGIADKNNVFTTSNNNDVFGKVGNNDVFNFNKKKKK